VGGGAPLFTAWGCSSRFKMLSRSFSSTQEFQPHYSGFYQQREAKIMSRPTLLEYSITRSGIARGIGSVCVCVCLFVCVCVCVLCVTRLYETTLCFERVKDDENNCENIPRVCRAIEM